MKITRLIADQSLLTPIAAAILLITFLAAWSPDFGNSELLGRSLVEVRNCLPGYRQEQSLSDAVASCPTERGERPFFTGLGDLPGGIYRSSATDVSADGLVVVGHSSSSASGHEAFQWTPSGGLIPLGFLHANGVSADGEVAVGFRVSASSSAAVGWTTCGEAFLLGEVPGFRFLKASAISADRSIIVGSGESLRYQEEAICWVRGGNEEEETVHRLGYLPGGRNSTAYDISADGSVVVGRSQTSKGEEAFRWTLAGGMVGLGMLPDSTISEARAVSADGSVVVGGGRDGAFLWTERDGIMELGCLSGGRHFCLALDVSADGSIIVGTSSQHSGLRAFVWDAIHGMRSVREVLEHEVGLTELLSGWRLTAATAVSADGRVFAGFGTNPQGNIEAWTACLKVSSDGPMDPSTPHNEKSAERILISQK